MSCSVEIPPNFKSAIQNNLCPSCNGPIMSDPALELLDEIKEAFQKMPNDPEGLAGWLLSNYEMRKIGSAEPVQFFNPRQMQQGYLPQQMNNNPGFGNKEDQLRNRPMVAPNKLQQFYQNAGVKSKDQYSVIAQQIQGGQAGPDYGNMMPRQPMNPILAQQLALAGETQMGYPPQAGYQQGYPQQGFHRQGYPQQGYPGDYSENYVEEATDPEYTQKALAAMNGGITREQMRAMAEGGEIDLGNGEESNSPALQALRMERLRKQQELAYGGEIGKIRRG